MFRIYSYNFIKYLKNLVDSSNTNNKDTISIGFNNTNENSSLKNTDWNINNVNIDINNTFLVRLNGLHIL